jgi:hypothetical protein
MQEYLFKIQNGLNNQEVLEIKDKMKDLDESQRLALAAAEAKEEEGTFGSVLGTLNPTGMVQQMNSKIDSGVSIVKSFSTDVYDEYMKPVLYKIQKAVGW